MVTGLQHGERSLIVYVWGWALWLGVTTTDRAEAYWIPRLELAGYLVRATPSGFDPCVK